MKQGFSSRRTLRAVIVLQSAFAIGASYAGWSAAKMLSTGTIGQYGQTITRASSPIHFWSLAGKLMSVCAICAVLFGFVCWEAYKFHRKGELLGKSRPATPPRHAVAPLIDPTKRSNK